MVVSSKRLMQENQQKVPYSYYISRVFNFEKSQAPYFPTIKFRDFERKLELRCINFAIFFLFFNVALTSEV